MTPDEEHTRRVFESHVGPTAGSSAANEPESLADYFERTKGEKQRSLKKLGHGQGAASVPCAACNGTGKRESAWTNSRPLDCRHCNGTGVLRDR